MDMNFGGVGVLFNPLEWQSLYSGFIFNCLGVKDNEFVSKPVRIACRILKI